MRVEKAKENKNIFFCAKELWSIQTLGPPTHQTGPIGPALSLLGPDSEPSHIIGLFEASRSRLWPSSLPGPSMVAHPGAMLGEEVHAGTMGSVQKVLVLLIQAAKGRFLMKKEQQRVKCSGTEASWMMWWLLREMMGLCTEISVDHKQAEVAKGIGERVQTDGQVSGGGHVALGQLSRAAAGTAQAGVALELEVRQPSQRLFL